MDMKAEQAGATNLLQLSKKLFSPKKLQFNRNYTYTYIEPACSCCEVFKGIFFSVDLSAFNVVGGSRSFTNCR